MSNCSLYNCVAFLSALYRRIYTELFYVNTEILPQTSHTPPEDAIPLLNPDNQSNQDKPLTITINNDSDSGFEFV